MWQFNTHLKDHRLTRVVVIVENIAQVFVIAVLFVTIKGIPELVDCINSGIKKRGG